MALALTIDGEIQQRITDSELFSVETELKFVLPPSYKDFVKLYGAGLLCGLFAVFIPARDSQSFDLKTRNLYLKNRIKTNIDMGLWDKLPDTVSKDCLLTLEPFGESENGDILCWDINQQKENGEYPIYLLDNEQATAILTSWSLEEFVNEFCLGGRIDTLFPLGQGQRWNLPKTFIPY